MGRWWHNEKDRSSRGEEIHERRIERELHTREEGSVPRWLWQWDAACDVEGVTVKKERRRGSEEKKEQRRGSEAWLCHFVLQCWVCCSFMINWVGFDWWLWVNSQTPWSKLADYVRRVQNPVWSWILKKIWSMTRTNWSMDLNPFINPYW